jgi:hypothetical protein
MTAEELRKQREIITGYPDMTLAFFGKELLCTLLEIAAQLAELNEQGAEFREIVSMWARAKGFIR